MSVLTQIRPRPSVIDNTDRGLKRFYENEVSGGVILRNYWYKPGISGTFGAYMQNSSGGGGFISSTAHATKGFIYLGSALSSAFDETNERLGLNVAAPSAKLHMEVAAPVGQFMRPALPVGNLAAITWSDEGGSTADADMLAGVVKTSADDTQYIKHTRQLGTLNFGSTNGTDPGVNTGHILKVRVRVPVDSPPNANDYLSVQVLQGASTIVDQHFPSDGTGVHTGFPVTSPAALDATASFATYEYTRSGTQADNITDYTDVNFAVSYYTGFDGGSEIQCAEITLEVPPVGGGSAETLQTWQTPSYSDDLDFGDDGAGSTTLDLILSGDAPLRISSGGGTSGLRLLTSSTNGRLEAGTAAQGNMNLVLSGARDATGTELTSKFSNTRLTGTIEINGGGPVVGDVLTAVDTDGLGTWSAPAGLATRIELVWIANGPFLVDTSVDGGRIADSAMTITGVWLYRTTPGTSGSTVLDLNKNGTSMYTTQGNRPTIAFDDGDSKVDCTLPDVVTVAAGDVITVDTDSIEGGTPQHWMLVIEGA